MVKSTLIDNYQISIKAVNVMSEAFRETFERMEIEPALLTLLCQVHRSTSHKWLSGDVKEIPAAAETLIRLLEFVQKRSPELFCEFMILQDFRTPSEIYLSDPACWKSYEFCKHKVTPKVLDYLEKHLPE
ncbi:hypothetical protein [Hafnia alvei]|nr:hypothetical protein [Hafnia alvei]NLS55920.1 hypothetical protein [Hafnia alvei]